MVRATGVDEQDRFLDARLRLPLELVRADHYEIIGRTFAALPSAGLVYIRLVRVLSRPNEEPHLMDTLREQQPRLVELGLVASHIGRRVVGTDVEAVSVGIWPDRAVIGGGQLRWAGRSRSTPTSSSRGPTGSASTRYDGIEIAPRLPWRQGPPLFIFDDDLRIVDLTASAAATLGWEAEDLVGVVHPRPDARPSPIGSSRRWRTSKRTGVVTGQRQLARPGGRPGLHPES